MKRLTKLLLTLCTGFLFLGFSFAQNQQSSYEDGDNLFTDDNDSNINSEFNSGLDNTQYSGYYVVGIQSLDCSLGIEWFSYWFLKLTLLMLIFLSLCAIPLYKKFKNIDKNANFFCFPLLNLYPLFKITIGKIGFYCIMVYLLFLGCIIYKYDDCDDNETLPPVIFCLWIFSITILLILGYKLIMLYKGNSDKQSSKE